jgi:periplasmic divalent cation tolerance protein
MKKAGPGPRDARIVLVTAPARRARSLARRLVDARLAACVNLVPRVRSIYRWKGKVEEGSETLLVMKTVAGRVAALEVAVRAHHPYEVPEFLVLRVHGGLPAYLCWMAEATGP